MENMSNKYDWGIYNYMGGKYDFRDKGNNLNISNSYMLVKTLRMFEYEGLPETIDIIEMERILQTKGYVIIIEYNGEVLAIDGALGGEPDMYNRPTKAIISNPALKISKEYEIGSDCVVISNDYLKMGLLPLFNKYNTMLLENEITMILANYNKRVDNLISVADDNTSISAKKYLQGIEDGKIGHIFENKLFESLKSNPTTNNASVRMNELIEYQQYLKSNLFNEIGLNSIHNMKKERMVVDEVNADSDSIYTLIDSMLQCRVIGLEMLKEMFSINAQVEFGGTWVKRELEVEEPEDGLTNTSKDKQITLLNEDDEDVVK